MCLARQPLASCVLEQDCCISAMDMICNEEHIAVGCTNGALLMLEIIDGALRPFVEVCCLGGPLSAVAFQMASGCCGALQPWTSNAGQCVKLHDHWFHLWQYVQRLACRWFQKQRNLLASQPSSSHLMARVWLWAGTVALCKS